MILEPCQTSRHSGRLAGVCGRAVRGVHAAGDSLPHRERCIDYSERDHSQQLVRRVPRRPKQVHISLAVRKSSLLLLTKQALDFWTRACMPPSTRVCMAILRQQERKILPFSAHQETALGLA
jgi:hypothetical protein